jgi:hypothetical protein
MHSTWMLLIKYSINSDMLDIVYAEDEKKAQKSLVWCNIILLRDTQTPKAERN